ncbi:mediator of RNA polymerase II transcription subunit 7b [Rosa chinensis]|uniref:mediator of RNA polymerase II transcription subunit 7b n=1 Tax=Rosa chinensis TaxID=74649 RepID=UPI001AD94194|nr:mediator of RNA polymerase II transcription subunit 7b [Rosa chinensis]
MKKEIDAIRSKDVSQGRLTQGQQTQISRNEQRTEQILDELENLEETLNESLEDTQTADVLPSLEEQEVRQLYPKGPNIDFKKELRSLNRELQLHIFELADILVERPSQYARRVEEISLIFQNLHHRLNSLRPHQARVTLIHILELQTKRHKQAVEDIQRFTCSWWCDKPFCKDLFLFPTVCMQPALLQNFAY